MKTMKFSKDYTKLDDRVFTTIRRRDKWEAGETVKVEAPTKNFHAKIIYHCGVMLDDLSTEVLCYDTDTETREKALTLLNSFYRKPLAWNEYLEFYLLRKEGVAN